MGSAAGDGELPGAAAPHHHPHHRPDRDQGQNEGEEPLGPRVVGERVAEEVPTVHHPHLPNARSRPGVEALVEADEVAPPVGGELVGRDVQPRASSAAATRAGAVLSPGDLGDCRLG